MRPGEIVGELVALLDALNVGIRLAAEISKAGNVDSRIGAAGSCRVVKICEAAASVLEAEFVDLVVAESPGVLHHAGYVAIGLLRSSRISILSERLVLAADFNAGDGAGADVGAQRQPVAVAEVVIQAQRIKARAFEDRKVARLRCQRLIRAGTARSKARSRAGGREACNSGRIRQLDWLQRRPGCLDCLPGRSAAKDAGTVPPLGDAWLSRLRAAKHRWIRSEMPT